MATMTQHINKTCRGLQIVTPRAFPEDKHKLYLLSLEMTRSLIEEDIRDTTDDLTKLFLQNAYDDMTRAIYYAESAR